MACYSCQRGWCGWRATVNGVGGILAWVAWVACLRKWHASVDGVLTWVT